MEKMMERKMKLRINQIEERQISMTRQVDRVTQLELITSDQVAQVQRNIKEAESKLNQQNKIPTTVTY